jgi:hypothetical protein
MQTMQPDYRELSKQAMLGRLHKMAARTRNILRDARRDSVLGPDRRFSQDQAARVGSEGAGVER